MENTFKPVWNKIKGEAKIQWSKLTDDDLLRIEGEKDKLIGTIQERYNITKEQACNDVDKFISKHNKGKDDYL
jgi:uncharacterized protein YjbJ (UPF0337 family)